jgi:hypothetical protein
MIDTENIKSWRISNAFELISELKRNDVSIDVQWKHETCHVTITNPDGKILAALKNNRWFWQTFWQSTQKGNVYTFFINPRDLGFKRVPEYVREKNIPRQYVYNSRHKYDLVYQSPQKVWVKEKTT